MNLYLSHEITEKHFDRLFNLNVRGLLFATQAAAAAIGEQGGSIINIGSDGVSARRLLAAPSIAQPRALLDVITQALAGGTGPKENSCERRLARPGRNRRYPLHG